jgi:hypothetical protein
LLWTCNDCVDEIKWLPSGESRFKENMPRKCRINSLINSRTIEQLYSHKYVPTTTITTSVGKISRKYGCYKKKSKEKHLNGELFTMPINE